MEDIVYVTKYALTAGIKMYKIDDISVCLRNDCLRIGSYDIFGPKHYTFDINIAKQRFEEMREKKSKSLAKQLKKLRDMELKVVDCSNL